MVKSGEFEVLERRQGINMRVNRKARGDCFGEVSLMYSCPRSATVAALQDAVVWVLERQLFRRAVPLLVHQALHGGRGSRQGPANASCPGACSTCTGSVKNRQGPGLGPGVVGGVSSKTHVPCREHCMPGAGCDVRTWGRTLNELKILCLKAADGAAQTDKPLQGAS